VSDFQPPPGQANMPDRWNIRIYIHPCFLPTCSRFITSIHPCFLPTCSISVRLLGADHLQQEVAEAVRIPEIWGITEIPVIGIPVAGIPSRYRPLARSFPPSLPPIWYTIHQQTCAYIPLLFPLMSCKCVAGVEPNWMARALVKSGLTWIIYWFQTSAPTCTRHEWPGPHQNMHTRGVVHILIEQMNTIAGYLKETAPELFWTPFLLHTHKHIHTNTYTHTHTHTHMYT